MYQKAKKPLIFLLLFLVLISPYLDGVLGNKISLTALLAGIGTLMLDIIFGLEKKLSDVLKKDSRQIKQYSDWQEVQPEVLKKINRQLKIAKHVKITAIGLALRTHQSLIGNVINSNKSQDKIKIEINLMMIDKEFLEREKEHLPQSLIEEYHDISKGQESNINFWKSRHKDLIEAGKLKINLYKYDYLPNLYGVLIDDDYLFLGHTLWDKQALTGAGGFYEYYENDDDFGGLQKIQLFNSWFNFAKTNYEAKSSNR
ncbi:MAG: hypothetical protein AAF927_30710 [Bacteroidota bacterium]